MESFTHRPRGSAGRAELAAALRDDINADVRKGAAAALGKLGAAAAPHIAELAAELRDDNRFVRMKAAGAYMMLPCFGFSLLDKSFCSKSVLAVIFHTPAYTMLHCFQLSFPDISFCLEPVLVVRESRGVGFCHKDAVPVQGHFALLSKQ